MTDVMKRAAARQRRLADFPGEGTPLAGKACQLLCKDHVETTFFPIYAIGRMAHGGKYQHAGTGENRRSGVARKVRADS
jgi:hypothetical protein